MTDWHVRPMLPVLPVYLPMLPMESVLPVLKIRIKFLNVIK